MRRHGVTMAMAAVALVCAWPTPAQAQDDDDVRAITARVRGTFQDANGGLGVVSGDMTVVRFEIRNGVVAAIGSITGAMADSTGRIMGPVNQDLTMAVANVGSSCNQLRMDLAATDADVLQTRVHFDQEVAGFDSRNGTAPKTLGALCATGRLLDGRFAPAELAATLNNLAAALAAGRAR